MTQWLWCNFGCRTRGVLRVAWPGPCAAAAGLAHAVLLGKLFRSHRFYVHI
jgi:hypothetical protein